MSKLIVRAGFVGFGEVNTPREMIDSRCKIAADALRERGVILTETAPVSDDPAGTQASRAIAELRQGDFDALVVCIAGWIPSWAVIQVVQEFKHLPILLWGLSGWQDGDRFITTADQAGTTALNAVFREFGYNFKYLVNFKGGAPRYDEAVSFLRASAATCAMRRTMIGMTGYRDMRLYGTMYDGMLLKKVIGAEIEHIDLLEIKELMAAVSPEAIAETAKRVNESWDFVRAPREGTLENSIRLALAFAAKVRERGYSAFSFCDVDGVKKLLKFAPAGSLAILHEEMELPTVPENDSYGAVTEVILHQLTGSLPAYLEFYEFTENSALMGVPDYVPGAIVDGRVTVMPNAFGSFGEGLLNVSKVRSGTATIARLSVRDGKFVLHAALGKAVPPCKWEEAGWTPPAPQLPSIQFEFQCHSDAFLKDVMGQHYIIVYGDHLGLLKDYCAINGIELILPKCGDCR